VITSKLAGESISTSKVLLMRITLMAFTFGMCFLAADLTPRGSAADPETSQVIRVGMIGLDTSHVPAFTKIFNDPSGTGDFAQIEIVAGYPGGTDMPASRDRVEKFTEQIREMGVKIVGSIPELLEQVDVVLLESVDGRIHLEEAIPVIMAGKPLFIDKPLAGTLADSIAIHELAKQYSVPIFSASSMRFSPGVQELANDESLGGIVGAVAWGSCSYQPGTPDLYFYGIHGVELLYTLMGPGCQSVTRTHSEDTDIVTGVWDGGRIGTYRGIRKHATDFGAVAFGTKAIKSTEKAGGYRPLCEQIARFFITKESPVEIETTIEMFAFMEAADESKRLGGQPVMIAQIMATAREEAAKQIAAIKKP